MGGLNPALIASVDKDQISLLGRLQWKDHPMGAGMGSFSLNKFFPKRSHSLGIFAEGTTAINSNYTVWSSGIRWGYRVLFLEKYYLCAGIGVRYTSLQIPVYYFYDAIDPSFAPSPNPQGKKSLTTDFGLLIHNTSGRYLGISLKDVLIPVMPSDSSLIFSPGKTVGVQGMHPVILSRESSLLCFMSVDRGGAIQGVRNAFSLWQIQFNYYQHKMFVLGLGYKRVGKSYGNMTYRIAILPGNDKLMIGYSFDSKPYINDNKIHWNSSHEIMLKYRLPQNDD